MTRYMLRCITLGVALSSVGCGTQLALSGQARADYLKAIKPLGAHWVKSDVSTEEWRADWVGCGGLSNGGYADDAPPRSSNDVIFAAIKKKRQQLATCMSQKVYVFVPGTYFREP